MIVSNIAGTTRDAIDSYFENDSGKFLFIDTAGMRRKSKVDDAVEKYPIFAPLLPLSARKCASS